MDKTRLIYVISSLGEYKVSFIWRWSNIVKIQYKKMFGQRRKINVVCSWWYFIQKRWMDQLSFKGLSHWFTHQIYSCMVRCWKEIIFLITYLTYFFPYFVDLGWKILWILLLFVTAVIASQLLSFAWVCIFSIDPIFYKLIQLYHFEYV